MRKSPSYSMAASPNKFQIQLIFHKLELGLSNPTSKISLILRIGSQKITSPNSFKASKEINLQNTTLSFQPILYENKSGQYQEKIAQIDVCLTNSKLTNSIGIIKLDFAAYANQSTTFEKSEYIQMTRSVEYQGKVLFTVKGSLLEKGVKVCEDFNKRDYSEIGHSKRSLTPTPKSSARREINSYVPPPLSVAQRKLNQMNRGSSKSPLRQKEETKEREPIAENEQITLEKMMKNLKLEKENKESELKFKKMQFLEKEKNLQELSAKLQLLEKENQELNEENQKISSELNNSKEFLKQQQNIKEPIEEKSKNEGIEFMNPNYFFCSFREDY